MCIVHKYKLTFRKYPLNISLNSEVSRFFFQALRPHYGNNSFLLLNFRRCNLAKLTATRYPYKHHFLCVIKVESWLFTYDMSSIV